MLMTLTKEYEKKHMEIINEDNDRDQITNAYVVLALIQRVTPVEIINAVKMKLGKAVGPSTMNTMIVESGKIGVEVKEKLCQRGFYINERQVW